MELTWHGTATVELNDGKNRILFDPFLRQNRKLKTPTIDDFTGADAIFITHGHLDHIFDIPKICEADKNVPVYCTATPAATINKKGVDSKRLNVIVPGDRISVGDFNITVYKGKHVVFDAPYIFSVVPKCTVTFPKFFYQVYLNAAYPENDEIVIYEIENNGKRVLLTGSFGTVDGVEYPENPDVFVLAHGGSTAVPRLATPFIERIKPGLVVITHYDDAFPPVTKRINVEKCIDEFQKNHTGFKFKVPEAGRAFSI